MNSNNQTCAHMNFFGASLAIETFYFDKRCRPNLLSERDHVSGGDTLYRVSPSSSGHFQGNAATNFCSFPRLVRNRNAGSLFHLEDSKLNSSFRTGRRLLPQDALKGNSVMRSEIDRYRALIHDSHDSSPSNPLAEQFLPSLGHLGTPQCPRMPLLASDVVVTHGALTGLAS